MVAWCDSGLTRVLVVPQRVDRDRQGAMASQIRTSLAGALTSIARAPLTAVVTGGEPVGPLKDATEQRGVGESPPEGDLRYCSASLARIAERSSATFKPRPLNEPFEGGVMIRQYEVRVADAQSRCFGQGCGR